MKRILTTLIICVLLSPSSFALETIHVEDHEQQLITQYRLNFVTVAYYRTMKNISLYEDWRKGYDLAIRLHHLAGNAQHILNMHGDFRYCSAIKSRAEAENRKLMPTSENALEGRNSEEDLKKILEVLKRVSFMANGLFKDDFLIEVTHAETNSLDYRHQRKLPHLPGVNNDQEYFGQDWDGFDD